MKERMDRLVENVLKDRMVHDFSLSLVYGDFAYEFSKGLGLDEGFIGASVTKLFTTAGILKLASDGKLSLEDGLDRFFDREEIRGLHRLGARDRTRDIKVSNLLYQNTGFPDLEAGLSMGKKLASPGLAYEDLLEATRVKEALFEPDEARSNYTSLNFVLLSKIIERVEGKTLDLSLEDLIFSGLAMENTFIARIPDGLPQGYFKKEKISMGQRLINSSGAGGGVTSTRDLMVFIRAFAQGGLFDYGPVEKSAYYPLQKSFGPIAYGLGHMKMNLGQGYFLGHNGISGAFAFYRPDKDLYFTGTLNQFADQSLTVRLGRAVQEVLLD